MGDAYGVSLSHKGFVYENLWTGKARKARRGRPRKQGRYALHNSDAATLVASFGRGSKIGIEYVVAESKLKFYRDDETEPKYVMDLPTNVHCVNDCDNNGGSSEITHW